MKYQRAKKIACTFKGQLVNMFLVSVAIKLIKNAFSLKPIFHKFVAVFYRFPCLFYCIF